MTRCCAPRATSSSSVCPAPCTRAPCTLHVAPHPPATPPEARLPTRAPSAARSLPRVTQTVRAVVHLAQRGAATSRRTTRRPRRRRLRRKRPRWRVPSRTRRRRCTSSPRRPYARARVPTIPTHTRARALPPPRLSPAATASPSAAALAGSFRRPFERSVSPCRSFGSRSLRCPSPTNPPESPQLPAAMAVRSVQGALSWSLVRRVARSVVEQLLAWLGTYDREHLHGGDVPTRVNGRFCCARDPTHAHTAREHIHIPRVRRCVVAHARAAHGARR